MTADIVVATLLVELVGVMILLAFLGHLLRCVFMLSPNVKYLPQAGQCAGRCEGLTILCRRAAAAAADNDKC